MVFLWKLSDDFPDRLYGKYNHQRGPDRFIFWKGKDIPRGLPMPEFRFGAAAKALMTWDGLGNDVGLPLVSAKVAEVLSEIAANDVRFIDAKVVSRDKAMGGWAVLNPLESVEAIDREACDFWLIPGTQKIGGFRRLRVNGNCLGDRHIARDADYLPHIWVDLEVKLNLEKSGARGIGFVPPEEYLK